jgi:hypothetical protein
MLEARLDMKTPEISEVRNVKGREVGVGELLASWKLF